MLPRCWSARCQGLSESGLTEERARRFLTQLRLAKSAPQGTASVGSHVAKACAKYLLTSCLTEASVMRRVCSSSVQNDQIASLVYAWGQSSPSCSLLDMRKRLGEMLVDTDQAVDCLPQKPSRRKGLRSIFFSGLNDTVGVGGLKISFLATVRLLPGRTRPAMQLLCS